MILQNAIKITENGKVTYLPSSHRHDYRSYTFENGATNSVDGGRDYTKRGFSGVLPEGASVEEFCLTKEDSYQDIAKRALWGTLGKDGRGPLTYLPISELEEDHVKAIWKDYSTRLKGAQLIAVKYRLGIK